MINTFNQCKFLLLPGAPFHTTEVNFTSASSLTSRSSYKKNSKEYPPPSLRISLPPPLHLFFLHSFFLPLLFLHFSFNFFLSRQVLPVAQVVLKLTASLSAISPVLWFQPFLLWSYHFTRKEAVKSSGDLQSRSSDSSG